MKRWPAIKKSRRAADAQEADETPRSPLMKYGLRQRPENTSKEQRPHRRSETKQTRAFLSIYLFIYFPQKYPSTFPTSALALWILYMSTSKHLKLAKDRGKEEGQPFYLDSRTNYALLGQGWMWHCQDSNSQ